MRGAALIAALLLAGSALAQDDSPPPDTAPQPAPRDGFVPNGEVLPEGQQAEEAGDPPPQDAPQPEPRPDDLGDPEGRLDVLEIDLGPDPAAEAEPDEAPVFRQLGEVESAFAACTAMLDDLGVVYRVLDEEITAEDRDCGIVNPIVVEEIAPGVALRPEATLRCETALEMAEWTSFHLVPAAEALTDRERLQAIALGGSYTCRRRNNLATGPLSEHSFGNAVDVMSFVFEGGDPIPVEPRMEDGTMEEAFQRAARATSCLHFTTVLGPGTDAAHADHLHMDVARRSNGYRLCQ
ncbi:extensin family protein [Roseobacter sp. HKCCA0434]|uniref:extensin-like domain-containing protein n=1 Tax=Roseobacter sp. HKCCA0434 TaxID=3079297 RepID=UPI002905A933|nr:extensin family protein [Roseobacter sp. HKCCA0434]